MTITFDEMPERFGLTCKLSIESDHNSSTIGIPLELWHHKDFIKELNKSVLDLKILQCDDGNILFLRPWEHNVLKTCYCIEVANNFLLLRHLYKKYKGSYNVYKYEAFYDDCSGI